MRKALFFYVFSAARPRPRRAVFALLEGLAKFAKKKWEKLVLTVFPIIDKACSLQAGQPAGNNCKRMLEAVSANGIFC